MGMLSDLQAMVGVQRIKNGGKTRLSVSQITALIVNMSDARQFLPESQFNDVYALFKRLRKVKKKKRMDISGYYEISSKIIMRFNMLAPFILYSGNSPEEAQKLVESIEEQYGHLDALDIEKEIFGVPGAKSGKLNVALLVLTFVFLGTSIFSFVNWSLLRKEYEDVSESYALNREVASNLRERVAVVTEEKTELEEEVSFWEGSVVLVTSAGEKYHKYGCQHISEKECTIYTFEQAQQKGYEPCLDCNPKRKGSLIILGSE